MSGEILVSTEPQKQCRDLSGRALGANAPTPTPRSETAVIVNERAKELMYALDLGERRAEDAPQTIQWVHRCWGWDYAVIRDHLEMLEAEEMVVIEPRDLAGPAKGDRWWVPDDVTLTRQARRLLETDSYVGAIRRAAEG